MAAGEVGEVVRFFPKISVAIIDLKADLKIGDVIVLQGKDGAQFEQSVGSMQIEHKPVEVAKAGDSIGLKVDFPPAEKKAVFLKE